MAVDDAWFDDGECALCGDPLDGDEGGGEVTRRFCYSCREDLADAAADGWDL